MNQERLWLQNNLRVSVIIPTYNRATMLVEAIRSVKNQTSSPNEIIVVDDGSIDGTKDLFPIDGVTYIVIDHCGFPGKVRNIGVENSSCEYITFLDSDDIWHPGKLEEQKRYTLEHPNIRISHTKEKWIMNGKEVSQKKRKHKREGDVFKESLQGCILGPSTVILEKSLFVEHEGFKPDIEVGEDYDLWLRIVDKEKVGYIDKELITKYAGHGDQLSFKYGYIEPFKIEVLDSLIRSYELKEENKILAIEAMKSKLDIIINGCIKKEKLDAAQKYKQRKNEFLKLIQ